MYSILFFLPTFTFGISAGTVVFDTLLKLAEEKQRDSPNILDKNELVARIKESIAKASELLGLENFEDDDCEIDFSPFCPDGWIHSGDGVHCQVPEDSDYNGICERKMDFRDKSPLNKLDLSKTCGFKWPCKPKSRKVPESDDICPRYWSRNGDLCEAPGFYRGTCDTKLSLIGKSASEREKIALECDLEWSSKIELLNPKIDWNSPCPLGWSPSKEFGDEDNIDTCILDENQTSVCGNKLIFKTKLDKKNETRRCGLLWPFDIRIFGDYRSECPSGWNLDDHTGLCIAPSYYQGSCELRADPQVYSKLDKKIWSMICGVDFLPASVAGVDEGAKEDKILDMFHRVYEDGAIDESLKIIKRCKINGRNTNAAVLNSQLSKLAELKRNTKDKHFISTINHAIDGLKEKLYSLRYPSFLQVFSGPIKECPYGWRTSGNMCVAPESYSKIVSNCPLVIDSRDLNIFNENCFRDCRLPLREVRECMEDFVRYKCPLGWNHYRMDLGFFTKTICIAPKTFSKKSECGSTVDFSGRSVGFKKRWAFACGQHFPCFGDTHNQAQCVQNYYWECPAEWTLDDGKCIAPPDYRGNCERTVHLSLIGTVEKKVAFGERCHSSWPCVDFCKKDYSNECPKGWIVEGDKCKAEREDYNGPCGKVIAIQKNWGDAAKEEIEYTCGVEWPCEKKTLDRV